MTNEELNTALYEKVFAEQEKYREVKPLNYRLSASSMQFYR